MVLVGHPELLWSGVGRTALFLSQPTPQHTSRIFDREGVPRPKGTKRWDRSFFRECILADIYTPHSVEEVRTVVSAEVAARLDPEKRYGLWWFNRRGVKVGQVSEPGPDGRRYRKTYRWHHKPKEEWVAVPVPDSGIPRELVEAARDVVESNRKPARAGRRFWKLTGGISYCGGCGKTMCANHSTKTIKGRLYTYDYYCCSQRSRYGPDVCANTHRPRAGELEATVWNLISSLLKDPVRLRAGLEELIEEEQRAMRGNPDEEAEAWMKKLAEVDSKRSAYQDQQAERLITLDELRTKLAALEEMRTVALKELEALRTRREQLERLEHDADALLEHYAEMVPEALDELTPKERRDVYKMMRLKVIAFPDGSVEVTGVFGGPLEVEASRSMKTEDSW